MSQPLPHVLHPVIDRQWLGYELDCPYAPDDHERPCRSYEEDLVTEVPGCGVKAYLDSDWVDDPADSLDIPRQRMTGPMDVAVSWEHADEYWTIGPFVGATPPAPEAQT
jgi:hypothetical protein